MPISFRCPCGKVLKARDALAGRRTQCPACKMMLTIPDPEPDRAESEPAIEEWVLEPQKGYDPAAAESILGTSSDDGEPPSDEIVATDFRGPVVGPTAPPLTNGSTSSTNIPIVSEPRDSATPVPAREPWYYGFLDGYGTIIIILGTAQFAFIGLIFVGNALKSMEKNTEIPGLWGLAISFAILFSSIAAGALIRLAVDAARNMRVVRLTLHGLRSA